MGLFLQQLWWKTDLWWLWGQLHGKRTPSSTRSLSTVKMSSATSLPLVSEQKRKLSTADYIRQRAGCDKIALCSHEMQNEAVGFSHPLRQCWPVLSDMFFLVPSRKITSGFKKHRCLHSTDSIRIYDILLVMKSFHYRLLQHLWLKTKPMTLSKVRSTQHFFRALWWSLNLSVNLLVCNWSSWFGHGAPQGSVFGQKRFILCSHVLERSGSWS